MDTDWVETNRAYHRIPEPGETQREGPPGARWISVFGPSLYPQPDLAALAGQPATLPEADDGEVLHTCVPPTNSGRDEEAQEPSSLP